ncbi:MAG: TPR end-of-group domain-containing protein, partial [Candidatus Heimdallarchaeota archaeon]
HCWENNVHSAKTAEKIGYKFVQKYPVLYGWYNRVDNLLINLKRTFESSKDYKKIIIYGEEIVTYFNVHKSVITSSYLFADINLTYIHLAGAYAQTGNLEKGLEWLRKAIVNGFKDHDTLQRSPLLTPLRKHSQWQEVINKK